MEEHADNIIEWYEKFEDIEDISKLVDIKEIKKNEFNLNISRYVRKIHVVEEIDLKETFLELNKAYDEFVVSEEKMKTLLKQVGVL